ncbi:MAG TPA: class I SAM-dependent methyltransferase [Phototrophicaceae bacterium]|nr:class I SAM-dependent methyltransferase [Phototrophicaceae bacterium]
MLQEMQHPRFLELLHQSDQTLLATDLAELKARIQSASNFQNDGFWSDELADYIETANPSQFIQFHWIAEKHYAIQMRNPELSAYFDHYYLIGYARIISLMMRYHINMGHNKDDFQFIAGFLKSTFADNLNVSILEVGTGSGELMVDLVRLGYCNLEGIEITSSAARLARAALADTIGEERIHFLSFDEFRTAFPDKRYDVVIHSNLIEHIPPHKMDDFLQGIYTHLKPNGYMIVVTPNRLSGPHDVTRSFRPGGSPAEGFHLWEFDLTELEQVLSAAGFGRFMTVRSLPSLNDFWDAIPTEESFQYKRNLEQFLVALDWKLRKPIIDGMYFSGVVCQKLS